MHVSALVIADAVSIRENLLHVLGAGVSLLQRESYPAPLLADVGLVVNHKTSTRHLSVKLTLRRDGKPEALTEIQIEGDISMFADQRGYASTPFAIEARSIAIPEPGDYTLTATLDGGRGLTTNFSATGILSLKAPEATDVD